MNQEDADRLTRLEEQMKNLTKQLAINTKDTRAIRQSVDNFSGGKQALIWVAGFLISLGVVVATAIGVIRK